MFCRLCGWSWEVSRRNARAEREQSGAGVRSQHPGVTVPSAAGLRSLGRVEPLWDYKWGLFWHETVCRRHLRTMVAEFAHFYLCGLLCLASGNRRRRESRRARDCGGWQRAAPDLSALPVPAPPAGRRGGWSRGWGRGAWAGEGRWARPDGGGGGKRLPPPARSARPRLGAGSGRRYRAPAPRPPLPCAKGRRWDGVCLASLLG